MKDLFILDMKDYNPEGPVTTRPSARAIISDGEKVLLVYSKKYNYYKFPGGGIECGEDHATALIREVQEETGYQVIPDTISEYGRVLRLQKDTHTPDGIFQQENFYYFCRVAPTQPGSPLPTHLDAYEAEEGFTPVWIEPIVASRYNKYEDHAEGADLNLIRREAKVLDMADLELRKRERAIREKADIAALGSLNYQEMFDFVEEQLKEENEYRDSGKSEISYSRFEHTKRVVAWAKRLYDMTADKEKLRYEDLIIGTIFHDVGRTIAVRTGENHALVGVPISRRWLTDHGFSAERAEYISSLVGAHSDKDRMQDPDLDPNLLMLMEADLLDDMGAQGVVMDCMIVEAKNPEAVFTDCLDHIMRFTRRIQEKNPMVSEAGKRLWDEKTRIVREFTDALRQDLEI